MASYIRRRKFLATLGGAAATWPLAASAQQSAMPVIGFLGPASADGYASYLEGFRQGLSAAGFVEGRNVVVEYHWADNQLDRLPALAAECRRWAEVAPTPSVKLDFLDMERRWLSLAAHRSRGI
jgi:putative ABC transport system substrate-binding protein